jgi:uncharacterized glyoxalase superfamily protein PhnB
VKPRISVITIGVADLEKSLVFYRDGLPTEGIVGREFEHGAVAFFELSGGQSSGSGRRMTLPTTPACPRRRSVRRHSQSGTTWSAREEVDEVLEQARQAGAEIIKPPEDTFYGGYAGYFRDPNGHLWEVVWNPANIPADDSALT